MTTATRRALVLGGGGITGVAWEIGLLLGLERRGIRLGAADLVVGTSAGSVVAAQLTGPTPLEELFRAQVEGHVGEIPANLGLSGAAKLVLAVKGTRDEQVALARVGRMALRADTVSESERHAVIRQRVPVRAWPETPLRITAVNAITGKFTVFDNSGDVDLVDAVAASCAVPMVWPPVTIGSQRYFDGGIRSAANVDLAAGYDRVVVLAPQARGLRRGTSPAEQLEAIRARSSAVVSPDASARTTMGRNVLDPRARAASARAGLDQADRVAEAVRTVWG